MTRRDQVVRAWVERESPRHVWKSCVSYKGRTHRKSTLSRIRKAARQFNTIHLLNILTAQPQPATAQDTNDHHPELFPSN